MAVTPPRRYARTMGLLGPASLTERPARVVGTVQRGGEFMPAECWKCHAAWIEMSYWEARCLCGAGWVRTVGEITRPSRSAKVGTILPTEEQ
ncbi:MAG TPA: hypothetical protein VLK35_01905 [Methylomirabilota bacterium]|nr:hypothetical protein [Methylomirabilota bacterium]